VHLVRLVPSEVVMWIGRSLSITVVGSALTRPCVNSASNAMQQTFLALSPYLE
jgi:hypothetical protein